MINAITSKKISDQDALIIAFILSLLMFLVNAITGWMAESSSLTADALGMLADASVYILTLLIINRRIRFKYLVALLCGTLLLLFAISLLIDVIYRALSGESPESTVMVSVAVISLMVSAVKLYLLRRFRAGEVHLRSAWIFTSTDIIANLGIIVSGILVAVTASYYPDLIVGFAICLYEIKEAIVILNMRS